MREALADDAHSVQDAGEWGTRNDTVSSIRACRLSDGKALRRSARACARAAGTAGDTSTSEGPSSLASETHMHTRARSWPVYVPMCPSCPRRPAKCGGGRHPPHHPPPTSHAPAPPRTPSLDAPPGLLSTHLRPALHPPPTSSQVASSAHTRSPVRAPYVCMRRDANVASSLSTLGGRAHSVRRSHPPSSYARRTGAYLNRRRARARRSVLLVLVATARIIRRSVFVVATARIVRGLRQRRHLHTSMSIALQVP